MATTHEIQAFTEALETSQLRFIMDMSAEELEYLKNVCHVKYESLYEEVDVNKLRMLNQVELPENNTVTRRVEARLGKFFKHINEYAKLSDKEIGTIVQNELWASNSIYSKASALVENVIDRLLRSANGCLDQIDE